jgi:hypothetical protein
MEIFREEKRLLQRSIISERNKVPIKIESITENHETEKIEKNEFEQIQQAKIFSEIKEITLENFKFGFINKV